ncbi:MAG TPA: nickel pincer cofactor biosynthesis protein LarC [Candidatus Acidoferrum sp.]|nr:nickel pincer cofactor biosynthesis protein LarC [Candidatus Acidoferrum sp.]
MRVAYLDCFSGISGDMFLGALLDGGVPFELFEKTVADLKVGARLERSRVERAGIAAVKLDVFVNGEKDMPREEFWAQRSGQSSVASSQLPVAGDQSTARELRDESHCRAGQTGQWPPATDHSLGRSLSEILKAISGAPISERAQQIANEIFLALATAEARVHNTGMDDIHFHEVGAADAIVDVVCAAVGAEAVGVEQFISSPLNVGSGTVACAHGVMPVPAPVTLELLKGIPIYSGDIAKELVTPTGAAIVKVLAASFGPRPLMTAETIGYGAGTRDFPGHANVLRVSIGETQTAHANAGSPAAEEDIAILEANLDDLNPQLIGYIVEQALAEGALDVFTTPVQMKKNRPGTVLTILAPPGLEDRLLALLFRESSTLGVRTRHEKRYTLPRHHEVVATAWGEVRMKVANLNGTVSQYAPEYEDCRRIAAEHHVALKHVMQEAIRLYLERRNG